MTSIRADDGVCGAARNLLLHVPPALKPFWMDIHQLHMVLKRGGYPSVPYHKVEDALRGCHSIGTLRCVDHFNDGVQNCTHYKFDSTYEGYSCYKEQRDDFVQTPRTYPGWFVKHKSKYPRYHSIMEEAGYTKQKAVVTNDEQGAGSLESGTETPSTENGMETQSTVPSHGSGAAASESGDQSDSGKERALGIGVVSLSGYKLCRIDTDDQFIENLVTHNRKCGHDPKRISQEKLSFGLKEEWFCQFCKKSILRLPSPQIRQPSGQMVSEDCLMVLLSNLLSGINRENR